MIQLIILAGCVYIINEFRNEWKERKRQRALTKWHQIQSENKAVEGLDERVEYWTRNGSFNREQYLKYIRK